MPSRPGRALGDLEGERGLRVPGRGPALLGQPPAQVRGLADVHRLVVAREEVDARRGRDPRVLGAGSRGRVPELLEERLQLSDQILEGGHAGRSYRRPRRPLGAGRVPRPARSAGSEAAGSGSGSGASGSAGSGCLRRRARAGRRRSGWPSSIARHAAPGDRRRGEQREERPDAGARSPSAAVSAAVARSGGSSSRYTTSTRAHHARADHHERQRASARLPRPAGTHQQRECDASPATSSRTHVDHRERLPGVHALAADGGAAAAARQPHRAVQPRTRAGTWPTSSNAPPAPATSSPGPGLRGFHGACTLDCGSPAWPPVSAAKPDAHRRDRRGRGAGGVRAARPGTDAERRAAGTVGRPRCESLGRSVEIESFFTWPRWLGGLALLLALGAGAGVCRCRRPRPASAWRS